MSARISEDEEVIAHEDVALHRIEIVAKGAGKRCAKNAGPLVDEQHQVIALAIGDDFDVRARDRHVAGRGVLNVSWNRPDRSRPRAEDWAS